MTYTYELYFGDFNPLKVSLLKKLHSFFIEINKKNVHQINFKEYLIIIIIIIRS